VFTGLWIVVGAGVLVLLVAAVKKENAQVCTGVNIVIKGVSNNFFVDKNDILNELNLYIDGSPEGQPVSSFNLRALETDLQKNVWVKSSQLFFDNNHVLQIIVTEREPAARIFTASGSTFYIDSTLSILPLSDKFSARLPVFTNFPADKGVLTKQDSMLLRDVYNLSAAIQEDSFAMALVEQVDITPYRTFEMTPKIGGAVIVFGDGNNIDRKISKLKLFYRDVLIKSGWNYYSAVDVQYAGQIVARRKGAEDKSADSLRTLQIMHMIAQTAEHLASDSLQIIQQDNERNTTNVNLVEQSFQRDEEEDNSAAEKIIDQSFGGNVLSADAALAANAAARKAEEAAKKTAAKPAVKPAVKTAVKTMAGKSVVKEKPVVKKTEPKPAVSVKATTTVKPATNNKPKPVPVKAISDKPKAVMPKQKTNDY